MPTDDRGNEYDELIERLKAQAAAAAEGRIVVYESDRLTPGVQAHFWRNVVDFETAETTDLVKELKAIDVELPEPDDLDDVAMHKALWCIIEGLARLRVFLDQTDHLSDRELYNQLLRELLPEEMPALAADENSAWHIDALGYDKPESPGESTFQTIPSPLARTRPTIGIATCRRIGSEFDVPAVRSDMLIWKGRYDGRRWSQHATHGAGKKRRF